MKSGRAPALLGLAMATLAAAIAAAAAARGPSRTASALVVTTTSDSVSPCKPSAISLRCAIDQANSDRSGDAITFAIPASESGCTSRTIQKKRVHVCVIQATPSLPGLVVTASRTSIDGYTQAGARANTNAMASGAGDNAILTVQLDGSARASYDGIALSGDGDVVAGLAITNFSPGFAALKVTGAGATIGGDFVGVDPDGRHRGPNADGIVVDGTQAVIGGSAPAAGNVVSANSLPGILLGGHSSGATVQGNYVGTDASGTRALGNGSHGVLILGSSGNTIGGSTSDARNVLSGNTSSGIAIVRGGHNVVQGNFIGIDVTGSRALGNGHDGSAGLSLFTRNPRHGNNLIGGTALGTINVISGNLADGVDVGSGTPTLTPGNVVEGNAIGSTPDGKAGIPNARNGVFVAHEVNGAIIGGTAQGSHNLIAFNGKSGVLVGASPRDKNVHVAVNSNTIFSNGGLGIDLSPQGVVNCSTPPPGPNDYTPCPLIAVAKTTTASGTACSGCYIEVFLATGEADDMGHGEAQELLGATGADSTGHWTAQYTVGKIQAGDLVTATATRPATAGTGAETSEFAANVAAGAQVQRLRRHF